MIETLPPDLIRLIGKFLSISEFIRLASCNRYLRRTLELRPRVKGRQAITPWLHDMAWSYIPAAEVLLADVIRFTRLEMLSLPYNRWTSEDLRCLSSSTMAATLRDLSMCRFSLLTELQLIEIKELHQLQRLDIRTVRTHDPTSGISFGHFQHLRELRLCDTMIDAKATIFSGAYSLQSLSVVATKGGLTNPIDCGGLVNGCTSLHTLSLASTKITNESALGSLRLLTSLDVEGIASIKPFIGCYTTLTSLRDLNISAIWDVDERTLYRFTSLDTLSLQNCATRSLRFALPGCFINGAMDHLDFY